MTKPTIYLAGNPNSGKTTTFNILTGLHQKTGNFPGVTVECKSGQLVLPNQEKINIIDLPGAYSFYPTSMDERIVVQHFVDLSSGTFPQYVIYVADMLHIEKHILLLEQILDTGAQVILVLNMADQAERHGLDIHLDILRKYLHIPVIKISARKGLGIEELKNAILQTIESPKKQRKLFYPIPKDEQNRIDQLKAQFPQYNDYQRLLLLHHYQWLPFLSKDQRKSIQEAASGYDSLKGQIEETMTRYNHFLPIVHQSIQKLQGANSGFSDKFDAILTNKWVGPIIFFVIIFFVFQAIYSWAGYPMDLIDGWFSDLNSYVKSTLPAGWFRNLLADGIIAGLGGIVIFIPQIAILFLLIGILEEIGYMARAVFLFDRLMQRFGLSGRSIVSLISGGACAIPAIMTTRTISNWKERLTTILTVPFISCSARLPVYVLLVGIAVPEKYYWGFNLQGLAFTGLYTLGIMAALLGGLALKYLIKTDEKGFLAMQLPSYRLPVWRNIFLGIWEKTSSFVIGAGKIIMVISIIIWAMASYGPKDSMSNAETLARQTAQETHLTPSQTANLVASYRLENSYAGRLGKFIEPTIKPLGYDWKIGIALLTSFAAREVFVGTMSTIYSLGEDADQQSLRQKISNYRNQDGQLVFTTATSFSLLIFYVFAMQCMSTLAVVKRETNSWKWPALQFFFMTGFAYLAALLVYQLMK
ncbi:MAG TPA: ferrous iron transport protein B [Saprospiraceae bacterium]|nr:ferrous iron transport protein B [Saprospiraceae bacterium]